MSTDRNPHIQYLPEAGIGRPRYALSDLNSRELRILAIALRCYQHELARVSINTEEESKQAAATMERILRETLAATPVKG